MKTSILIQETTFEKIKKKINENKDKTIIFTSENDDLNRKILEKQPINIFLINQAKRKDKQKQRNSGLNQVLAKIAKKKNITIGINLDEIIESKGKSRSLILARVKQNIKLCNKNKIAMRFIALKDKNKRNSHNLKALATVLGMPTSMFKDF
jgi:RNase P/RNase MRP subunit p30